MYKTWTWQLQLDQRVNMRGNVWRLEDSSDSLENGVLSRAGLLTARRPAPNWYQREQRSFFFFQTNKSGPTSSVKGLQLPPATLARHLFTLISGHKTRGSTRMLQVDGKNPIWRWGEGGGEGGGEGSALGARLWRFYFANKVIFNSQTAENVVPH